MTVGWLSVTTIADVYVLLDSRRIPASLHRCISWRMARNGSPYGPGPLEYELRGWAALLETYPEWPEAEFLAPEWVLSELRMQEELGG